MRRVSGLGKAVLLGILFLIIVVGGRYIFGNKTSSVLPPSQPISSQSTSSPAIEKKAPIALSCVDEWKRKVEQEKIEYDRGSILVGFVVNVSFEEAVTILSRYNVVIRDMQYARENYDSRRLITASVKAGEEFTKLCMLKKDASVRYTGLNVLFALHD